MSNPLPAPPHGVCESPALRCATLEACLAPEANAHVKGFALVVATSGGDDETHRVVGVCYRTYASDRGRMLAFCPFCGGCLDTEVATATLHEAEQDRDTLHALVLSLLPGCFVCGACGPFVKVDESGCCTTCGKDCVPQKTAAVLDGYLHTRRVTNQGSGWSLWDRKHRYSRDVDINGRRYELRAYASGQWEVLRAKPSPDMGWETVAEGTVELPPFPLPPEVARAALAAIERVRETEPAARAGAVEGGL